jgi:hypothetical protein
MGIRYYALTAGDPPTPRGMIRRTEDGKSFKYELFDHKTKSFVDYPNGAKVDFGQDDNFEIVDESKAKSIIDGLKGK